MGSGPFGQRRRRDRQDRGAARMANQTSTRGPRLGLAAAILVAAAPAQAQSYVRPDCKPLIAADTLGETSLTARWYRRFWTGDCGDLHGCLSGSPNWNEVVGRLVSRSPAGDQPKVLAKACRLGPLIGLEWTRPNRIRRIDTGDLRRFKSALDGSRDVLQGLADVEAQARAKIG
jgi:hypothetical protein